MIDKALIEITGVYGILKTLYNSGEMPMTHLQSEVPNYQRLANKIEILYLEGIISIRQGDKKHIKLISLTSKGREYTEHIIAAEALREKEKMSY